MPINKFGHYFSGSQQNNISNIKIHLDSDHNFNLRRVKNIASSVLDNDAVNKTYLESILQSNMEEIAKQTNKSMEMSSVLQNHFDEEIKQAKSLLTYKIQLSTETVTKTIENLELLINKSIQTYSKLLENRLDQVENNLKRVKNKLESSDGARKSGAGTS